MIMPTTSKHSPKHTEESPSILFGYVLPVILGTCLISFTTSSYSALRILKDSFITKYSHPLALNFIKSTLIWGISWFLPLIISSLNKNVPNYRHRFYYIIFPFIAIYLAIYLLFPYCESIQTSRFIALFQQMGLGDFGIGIGGVIGYPLFVAFSVTIECWGLFAISILGWGVVNNMMPEMSERNRGLAYSFMSTIGNICSLLSTMMVEDFSKAKKGAEFIATARHLLRRLTLYTAAGMLVCYWLLTRLVKEAATKLDKSKALMSEEMKAKIAAPYSLVFSDRYYIYIAAMVAAYNFCIMAVDFFAKPAIGNLTADGKNMHWSQFMSITYQCNSISSIIIGIFNMVFFSHMSIGARALIPVLTMGITGTIFFISYIFSGSELITAMLSGMLTTTGHQVMTMAVATQMVGSKAPKYACLDPGKEAYMRAIDVSVRDTIKGAIDTAFNRLSKSSGSQCASFLLFVAAFLMMPAAQQKSALIWIGRAILNLASVGFVAYMLTANGRSYARKYWYFTIPMMLLIGYNAQSWFNAIRAMTMLQRYLTAYKASLVILLGGTVACLRITGSRRLRYSLALLLCGVSVAPAYKLYKDSPVTVHQASVVHHKTEGRDTKAIAPFMAVIFLLVVIGWGVALYKIHPLYQKKRGMLVTGITVADTIVILISTLIILGLTVYGIADFFAYKGIIKTSIPIILRPSQNVLALIYAIITPTILAVSYNVISNATDIAHKLFGSKSSDRMNSLVYRFKLGTGLLTLIILALQQTLLMHALQLKYSNQYLIMLCIIALALWPLCVGIIRIIKHFSPPSR